MKPYADRPVFPEEAIDAGIYVLMDYEAGALTPSQTVALILGCAFLPSNRETSQHESGEQESPPQKPNFLIPK
jgi:hypothetical protein